MSQNNTIKYQKIFLQKNIYFDSDPFNYITHQGSGNVPHDFHFLWTDNIVEHKNVWVQVGNLDLDGMKIVVGVIAVLQMAFQLGHEFFRLREIKEKIDRLALIKQFLAHFALGFQLRRASFSRNLFCDNY